MNLDLPLAVDIYLTIASFVLGAVIGSFVTCTAGRYGEKLKTGSDVNIWKGRSHCDNCGATLSAIDLVPIISYICLRGKCRHCGAKIPARCLVIEGVTACLYAGTYAMYGFSAATIEYMALFAALIAIALIDFDTTEIPNGLLLFGLIVFAVLLYPHGGGVEAAADRAKDGLLGGLVLGGGMLFLSLVMDNVLGRESMGGGDIKLFAMLGLFTGLAKGLVMLIAACVIGITVAFGSGSRKTEFPFGPAIAEAAVFALLFGQYIVDAYMSLII